MVNKAIFLLDEMPISCENCVYRRTNNCILTGGIIESYFVRQDWCPLKELPGPLIHSETDSEMMSHYKAGWNDFYSTITRKNDYEV